MVRLNFVQGLSSSLVQLGQLILPSVALCLFPPSGVLSAYWNWQQDCSSKCYPMFLFTAVILQHTHGFNLLTTAPSTQIAWPFFAVTCFYLLAMFCCQCYSYIWTDQCGFLQVLLCQFWEVCQPAYSMHAFTARDKTEMTRQLPFCQHCHGSAGMAVYPKVNGMTSGTESARLKETCACFI